ncbi:MAG: DUF4364 family protein [Eubacterium sp.]|nr:DUF4364 family protein [Eubacterium sp.]
MDNDKIEKLEKKLEENSAIQSNPRLQFDAFMAGVKDGGLRTVSTVHLMVCYIVSTLSGQVTADVIVQAMAEGQIANHFEVTNALSRLQASGVITEAPDGGLSINENVNADIELVEIDLPYTLRKTAIHLCQKIIAKETYRRENKVEILKNETNFTVVMHINGPQSDLMTLSVLAPTMQQAEMIKEKFITDPVKIYESVINSIFSNEE